MKYTTQTKTFKPYRIKDTAQLSHSKGTDLHHTVLAEVRTTTHVSHQRLKKKAVN